MLKEIGFFVFVTYIIYKMSLDKDPPTPGCLEAWCSGPRNQTKHSKQSEYADRKKTKNSKQLEYGKVFKVKKYAVLDPETQELQSSNEITFYKKNNEITIFNGKRKTPTKMVLYSCPFKEVGYFLLHNFPYEVISMYNTIIDNIHINLIEANNSISRYKVRGEIFDIDETINEINNGFEKLYNLLFLITISEIYIIDKIREIQDYYGYLIENINKFTKHESGFMSMLETSWHDIKEQINEFYKEAYDLNTERNFGWFKRMVKGLGKKKKLCLMQYTHNDYTQMVLDQYIDNMINQKQMFLKNIDKMLQNGDKVEMTKNDVIIDIDSGNNTTWIEEL